MEVEVTHKIDWGSLLALGFILFVGERTYRKNYAPKSALSGRDIGECKNPVFHDIPLGMSYPVKGNRLFFLDPLTLKAIPKKRAKGNKALIPIWAENAEQARKQAHNFSGATATCVAPYEVETEKGSVIRCAMYAPSCEGQKDCKLPAPVKGSPKFRHCVEYKKTTCNGNSCLRCVKMESLCAKGSCFGDKIPLPEKVIPAYSEVVAYAKSMAQEDALTKREGGPWLYREIMERGGLREYRRPTQGTLLKGQKGKQKSSEEWMLIPLHLKRKTGKPLDEMASEMGLDEQELVELILKSYGETTKEGRKKKYWQDYIDKARTLIMQNKGISRLGDLGIVWYDKPSDFSSLLPSGIKWMIERVKEPELEGDSWAFRGKLPDRMLRDIDKFLREQNQATVKDYEREFDVEVTHSYGDRATYLINDDNPIMISIDKKDVLLTLPYREGMKMFPGGKAVTVRDLQKKWREKTMKAFREQKSKKADFKPLRTLSPADQLTLFGTNDPTYQLGFTRPRTTDDPLTDLEVWAERARQISKNRNKSVYVYPVLTPNEGAGWQFEISKTNAEIDDLPMNRMQDQSTVWKFYPDGYSDVFRFIKPKMSKKEYKEEPGGQLRFFGDLWTDYNKGQRSKTCSRQSASLL